MLGTGETMRQGYIAQDRDVSVRIRITDHDAVLAVKAGPGLARTEVQVTVADDQAAALWPLTDGRRIEKTRYRVPLEGPGDLLAEVDIYAGALVGLCTVEVEFESERDAHAFTPPAWFGPEVTGNTSWSNSALAKYGRPAEPPATG